jgi:hypothetical protein
VVASATKGPLGPITFETVMPKPAIYVSRAGPETNPPLASSASKSTVIVTARAFGIAIRNENIRTVTTSMCSFKTLNLENIFSSFSQIIVKKIIRLNLI